MFSDEKELGVSPTASGATSALHPNVAACAEQALLRVALILHEHARKFDARIRAASRSIASGLRSRKRKARHLLARSALLVVDHGLANGSLDALRGRFSFARTGRAGSGPGSPTMSVASGDEYECGGDFTEGGGGAELRMEGDASSVSRAHGRVFIRPAEGADSGRGNRSSGRTETRYGGHEDAQTGRSGEGVAQGLGKDALQYAAAVHFLVAVRFFCLWICLALGTCRGCFALSVLPLHPSTLVSFGEGYSLRKIQHFSVFDRALIPHHVRKTKV